MMGTQREAEVWSRVLEGAARAPQPDPLEALLAQSIRLRRIYEVLTQKTGSGALRTLYRYQDSQVRQLRALVYLSAGQWPELPPVLPLSGPPEELLRSAWSLEYAFAAACGPISDPALQQALAPLARQAEAHARQLVQLLGAEKPVKKGF